MINERLQLDHELHHRCSITSKIRQFFRHYYTVRLVASSSNSAKKENMVAARIYIVRHGETEANRQRIIQGQLDTKLNEAGIEQAKMTASALEKVPFEAAYTSDLSRAVQVSIHTKRENKQKTKEWAV